MSKANDETQETLEKCRQSSFDRNAKDWEKSGSKWKVQWSVLLKQDPNARAKHAPGKFESGLV